MNKHLATEVTAQLLRNLNIGTDPLGNGPWPTFVEQLPTDPDSAICVMSSEYPTEGRIQRTGETEYHESIRIRIRDKTYIAAREKTVEIMSALDGIVRKQLSVEEKLYQVQCYTRQTLPVWMGPDPNHRVSFVLNYLTKVCAIEV